MMDFIEGLGTSTRISFNKLGRGTHFLVQTISGIMSVLLRPRLLTKQLYSVGVMSFLIITISGLFVGMVLGLQGYYTLSDFGAEETLGVMVAASLVRELGPVVSALLFAGRAGSALTAEIGLMKTTEQLASMDMMGVDPLGRIIYPRFIAGMIALPMLSLIFAVVAIFGGYFIGVQWLGIDAGSFWSNMQAAVDFRIDVLSGIIKSVVFAFVVIWIALFQGFMCVPTAEGISQATTRTVVYSSLAVLGFDFLLTAMMIGGW